MRTVEQPLVQIIHYTDMHLADAGYIANRWRLSKVYPHLPHEHKQGWAGPRRSVLHQFEELIREYTVDDPIWRDVPTWLVDTGDGTTFGDVPSLDEWKDWSDRFKTAGGKNAELMRVYGNHDAWPGLFPALDPMGQIAMEAQRIRLRTTYFPAVWPEKPWAVTIPGVSTGLGGAPAQIELYAVNTVDHGVVENSLALGYAARDGHLTVPRTIATPADDLAQRALAQGGGSVGKSIRIAAMHFPIADGAAPGYHYQKVLRNRAQFAKDLRSHHQVQPFVAHLILAGHTHGPFPGVGQLPRSASAATHAPLVGGQCQIVSASLSQQVIPGTTLKAGAGWPEQSTFFNPYQCTLLRFFSQPDDPEELIMDRAIAGADDRGMFNFLPLAPGNPQSVERMTFRL